MIQDDRILLGSISEGIPLIRHPFQAIGAPVGLSGKDVTARLRMLINEGVIRRFGARIDHRLLGIVANAMVCWKVPERKIEEVARIVSGYPGVTHCYEREVTPGIWEYNFYCVVHGYSEEEVKHIVQSFEEEAGIYGHVILFSEKKYKHIPFTVIGKDIP